MATAPSRDVTACAGQASASAKRVCHFFFTARVASKDSFSAASSDGGEAAAGVEGAFDMISGFASTSSMTSSRAVCRPPGTRRTTGVPVVSAT